MRKIFSISLAIVFLLVTVTACGQGGKESGEQSTANEAVDVTSAQENGKEVEEEGINEDGEWEYKEAELTLLIDADSSLAGINAVLDLAKEKLGITVEIETRVGGNDGSNIVKTRLASGDMADLCAYNSGSNLSALNPSEHFIDLSNEGWIERLDETFVEAVSVDNGIYGIPMSSTSAGAVLYSKPLYEKYNLEVPTTWDEFIANCDILKENGEVAVIGTYADTWTAQVMYLGDHYNVMKASPDFAKDFEAGKAKYATTEAGLRSFEKLAQMNTYYNSDYLATTYNDGCDIITNAEGAHWVILTQALANIHEIYGEQVNDIGVFGIPGEDETGLTVWASGALYGNKNSGKTEDILRLMEFFVSDIALDAFTAAQLPNGPYSIKGYELPENVYEAVKEVQTYFDTGKTALALEFQTAVKGPNCAPICQELGSGQTTPLEAAEAYDADCLKQAIQLGLDWE